jgi:hypothetical protein
MVERKRSATERLSEPERTLILAILATLCPIQPPAAKWECVKEV